MTKELSLTSITADNLEIGLFRYNLGPNEKFVAVSSTLVRMLGYSSKWDFLKEKFENLFFTPKDKSIFFEILLRNRNVKLFEVALKKKDGQILWVAINACGIFSRNHIKCLEGTIQDISYKRNYTISCF